MKFDRDEFERWLIGRGVQKVCPSCGHDGWIIPELSLGLTIIQGRSRWALRNYKEFVPVRCPNCGLVRLHSLETFGQ